MFARLRDRVGEHFEVDSDELVVLGAQDSYESRCRFCFDPDESQQARLEITG